MSLQNGRARDSVQEGAHFVSFRARCPQSRRLCVAVRCLDLASKNRKNVVVKQPCGIDGLVLSPGTAVAWVRDTAEAARDALSTDGLIAISFGVRHPASRLVRVRLLAQTVALALLDMSAARRMDATPTLCVVRTPSPSLLQWISADT